MSAILEALQRAAEARRERDAAGGVPSSRQKSLQEENQVLRRMLHMLVEAVHTGDEATLQRVLVRIERMARDDHSVN